MTPADGVVESGFSAGGLPAPDTNPSSRAAGVVYSRPWVVAYILDLAGYRSSVDLTKQMIVDPCCGEGAFVIQIVQRLMESAKAAGVAHADLVDCIRAYDLDPQAVRYTRVVVTQLLVREGVASRLAARLSETWVNAADFLLAPPPTGSARWVVGNPPYVRTEMLLPQKRAAYRIAWPTMKHRADIYMGFFAAGMGALSDEGVLAFITPDRWIKNKYGEALRRSLSGEFQLDFLAELHVADAFERRVSAYPTISIIRRGSATATRVLRFTKPLPPERYSKITEAMKAGEGDGSDEGVIVGEILRSSKHRWALVTADQAPRLERWEKELVPLEDSGARVRCGIATGADGVFITSNPDLVESGSLIPAVGPADLKSGILDWTGRYLVSPWRGDDLVQLGSSVPRLARYFSEHEATLRSRYVAKRNPDAWWRTIDRPVDAQWRREKLVVADINHRISPVLVGPDYIPLNTVFYITSDRWRLRVLGGFLLSDDVGDAVRSYSLAMTSGRIRLGAQYLRMIRLPEPESLRVDDADGLAAAFENRDRRMATDIATHYLSP